MNTPEHDKTSCLKSDVVVMGSGGLAAAVAAQEKEASVILLERENILGGNTMQANGFCTDEDAANYSLK